MCWRRMPLSDGAAASRRNQHGVETKFEIGMFGCVISQACAVAMMRCVARRDRIGGVIESGAGLDLDEGEKLSPPRHNIDLAMRGAKARQDAIAFGDQIGRGAAFCRKAGAEGCDALGRCVLTIVPGAIASVIVVPAATLSGELECAGIDFASRPAGDLDRVRDRSLRCCA